MDRCYCDVVTHRKCPLHGPELERLDAEIARLKAGKFTAEEIHGICHNLHDTVDARGFADGCAAEQRKLYGCALDADRVHTFDDRIRAEIARIESRIDHARASGADSLARIFVTIWGELKELLENSPNAPTA